MLSASISPYPARQLTREIKVLLIALVLALLGRAILLEYTDLIDPTESRYASVASLMVDTGDWLTPRLPMETGIEPYLGKPPLHFWFTSVAYTLFGVDEWTSRLPSFLAFLVMILSCVVCGKRMFGTEQGVLGALILCSSAMPFFLAGASVVDVTFSALVGLSVGLAALFILDSNCAKGTAMLSALFAGLAVMVKGPAGIVLAMLPVMLWSAIARDFSWARRLPWLGCVCTFLVVIAPWFFACEIHNPGFIKYFIWNENVERYLFADYGDRYGSGHVHGYGMAWLMLIAASLPWVLIPITALFRSGLKESWRKIRADRNLLFVLCWGLSPAILFTFVRQLHAMYLLPGVVGLALTSAVLLSSSETMSKFGAVSRSRIYIVGLVILWISALITAVILGASKVGFVLGIVFIGTALLFLLLARRESSRLIGLSSIGTALICTYLLVIVAATPRINLRRSAEEILKRVVLTEADGKHVHRVGILSQRAYSFYWISWAWKGELGRKIEITYMDGPAIRRNNFCHVVLDRGQTLPPELASSFEFVETLGDFTLLRRIKGR